MIIVNAIICLFRVIKGPTIQDRVLAINIVGSKMLIILVLLAFVLRSSIYLDVAILLILLNFVVIVTISRYLETYSGKVN
jgi:multicomponent Na+:H+ antiporter subunit F